MGQNKEIQRRCKQASRGTEIKLGMYQERRDLKKAEVLCEELEKRAQWREGREALQIFHNEVIGYFRETISGKGERQTTRHKRDFFILLPIVALDACT